jgi:hypothetical protein
MNYCIVGMSLDDSIGRRYYVAVRAANGDE